MIDVLQYLADGQTLQVSIPSIWRSNKAQAQSAASQTAQIRSSDQASQANEHSSRGTQTDRLFKRYSDAVRGGPGLGPVVAFLAKVTPLIEQAITDNLTSPAADQDLALPADLPTDVTLTHTLQGVDSETSEAAQLCCTSVSWSSTGQGIAVAYGRFDVEGWCSQPGYLCTWNLARSGLKPDKPDVKVETDSCLQCCCYHPNQPALIAGGTFVGDVCVWNLAQDGDFQVFKSTLSASSHQEAVTAVAWHSSTTEPLLQRDTSFDVVISLSLDGRLLLWQWDTAQLLYGFELHHQHPETRKTVLWGGSCMAVLQGGSRQASAACLIGTEGGAVFRCSLETDAASLQAFAQAQSTSQVALNSSGTKSLLYQHTGPVHAVHSSPFDANLTVSCGLDGQVRLGNSLTKQPLLELSPSDSYLFCGQWSPTKAGLLAVGAGDNNKCMTVTHLLHQLLQYRQNSLSGQWSSTPAGLLAVGAGDGRVFLYDFGRNRQQPVQVVDVCGASAPVYALAFNQQAPELFATADQTGVKVWTLASGLILDQSVNRAPMLNMLTKSARKMGL